MNAEAYDDYIGHMNHKLQSDPKSFWKFVNKKRKVNGIPSQVTFDGMTSSSDQERCDVFADFLESVYSPPMRFDAADFQYLESMPSIGDLNIDLSVEVVHKGLLELDGNKGAGPDNLPPFFLKMSADALCRPIHDIFVQSFESGYFPLSWKKSFLMPIHKNGRRDVVTNYRGIAILSTIPKLFEKLIYDQISTSIVSILHPSQHGFESGKSTTTNLFEYCSSILNHIAAQTQVDAIYTDFSKAFDRVDHGLLLHKLKRLGFDDNFVLWLTSYLTDRVQNVKLDSLVSRSITVSSGVPQGSHIGPLLFLIFINDLCYFLHDVQFLLYADDLKIFQPMKCADDFLVLQENVVIVDKWCSANGMSLNVKKCNVITFSRKASVELRDYAVNGNKIERTFLIKDLGVWLDDRLSFKRHVDITVAKANSVWSLVKRFGKEFKSVYTIKHLYMSLVLPILEFGSIVWMPLYDVDASRIESVQKQFLLFCLKGLQWSDRYILPPYKHRLNLVNMLTLRDRQTLACCIFVYDVLRGNIRSSSLCEQFQVRHLSHNLRNFRRLEESVIRTNYLSNSPVNRCTSIFNVQCSDLNLNISKCGFRKLLINKFRMLYYR